MHVQRIGRRGFLQRKLGLLAALGLAPALLPKRVLAGPDMAVVERRAQLIVRESGYNITVSITDLNTGVTAAVGGDAIRYPGCTLNMLVLASVVRDVQRGAYPLEQVDDAILYTIRNSSAERARDLEERIRDNQTLVASSEREKARLDRRIADASALEALARDVRALLQSEARLRRQQEDEAARLQELVAAVSVFKLASVYPEPAPAPTSRRSNHSSNRNSTTISPPG